jgi:hypothetical protein
MMMLLAGKRSIGFETYSDEVPLLNFPYDYKRPVEKSIKGSHLASLLTPILSTD